MTSENVTSVRAVSRDLFSATIGSVCCCYVGQPFDTVKVRMQTSPDVYNSVVGSTTSIIRNEGIPALWKGAVPTAGGMVLENCMAFGVNEALKRAFPNDPEKKAQGGPPDLFKPFLMVCIDCTWSCPMECVLCSLYPRNSSTSWNISEFSSLIIGSNVRCELVMTVKWFRFSMTFFVLGCRRRRRRRFFGCDFSNCSCPFTISLFLSRFHGSICLIQIYNNV